jgi:TonB family protein
MVTIIIVPVGVIQKKLSSIYFLGSLLDKKSFKHEFRDLDTFFKKRQKTTAKLFLDDQQVIPVKRIGFGRESGLFLENSSKITGIDSIIGTEKLFPDMVKKERVYSEPDSGFSEISGKAKNRIVLFKPPFPDYKVAVSARHKDDMLISCSVKLRLIITKDGTVKAADILQTSGYPDINLIAVRYVKKWKFIPLKPDQPQEDQEGVVQIEFGH